MPEEKLDKIIKARMFAAKKFHGLADDAGLPKYEHSFVVAELVSTLTEDAEVVQAAYLHDVLEDTDTDLDELEEEFGYRVAKLVSEVTHDGTKETGYYFPRLKSKEAILIKFCDRAHNISRMEPWDEKRQQQYLKNSRFWRIQKNAASLEMEKD